jgi:HK97 family phage portal protein
VTEDRAVFRSSADEVPNGNNPADVPPGTVGPDGAVPGDPHGVLLVDDGPPAPPWPRSRFTASPWSGWPAEWATPSLYGRVQSLTDTAWACLDKNSGALATMPAYLVGASPSLPVDWLNNPDPEQYPSWWAFIRQLFWDYQLGEAYVLATARYSNGYPARFHVVPPWTVNAEIDSQGLRRYHIGSLDVTADLLAIHYQITAGEAHGHGPLEAGASRLVAASALARYAGTLAASGAIPNAVLKHPHNLNAQQAQDLQMAWVEARTSGMGLPAVLSGGIDFETLQISPAEMALLELSQFMEQRIAVLLGVPPYFVALPSGGDSLTYSTVSMALDYWWRSGLSTKAAPVMQALSGWLLPRGTTVELNRDEFVKPGWLERAQTFQTMFNIYDPITGERAMQISEIRQAERLDAAPSQTLTSGVLQ